MPKTFTIYPNGQGHFALGSPDGRILQQGESVALVLGEQAVVGEVAHDRNGDYVRDPASGSTLCGLYACMTVCLDLAEAQEREAVA